MSSSYLLRRCVSPLTATRIRTCAAPYVSLRVLSPSFSTLNSSQRVSPPRFAAFSPRPLDLPVGRVLVSGKASPVLTIQLKRFYSPGRNPWQSGNDWKSTLKTGGLVLLGTGALIASTSLAFGVIIAGAAGFGMYTLYQRFFRQFRSNDPFRNVSSNIDTLNDMFTRSRHSKSAVQDDLSSLVQGMPLVVRGIVKTVFSFVGKAMQSSMERAGELRRRTDEYLQANNRVRQQMGENVSVGGPEQWIESTVNGVGRIEAVFPVNGAYGSARVNMKASVGQGDQLNFTQLKYRNLQTGDVIDLLRDSSVGGRRKTVIDAEYVDLDDNKRW
ncbi:hypothetical protein P3T76_002739 [Phytophthora citrophthora]|uniref:Uncharacterized protein n=1 Tax=Phytophthora citrophthora TaxID=4793 RepID=A0AAD9GX60_9STRA|nr:hypothetical protein P3T76_002739 [Phytophthora citrophthora]